MASRGRAGHARGRAAGSREREESQDAALRVFPVTNWWNLDMSQAPVDPNSQAFIDWISGRTPQNPTATRRLHPGESDTGAPGGPLGYDVLNPAFHGLTADDFEVIHLGWNPTVVGVPE